jgi:predicted AAA+ superfamily ATPase
VPPRNIVHAAVDGWRAADLQILVSSARTTFLAGVTGTRYWFIDEISSVIGDWPNTIKNLRDNNPDFAADTVVLAGSSAAQLHEVRKALAGRRGPVDRSDRIMLPMPFTDFARIAEPALPEMASVRPKDLVSWTSPSSANSKLAWRCSGRWTRQPPGRWMSIPR